MKIGIFGGSFNPVHFGHTGLAEWIVRHTDLDCVWMMVSPNNPLKERHTLANEQERLLGVRRAVANIEGVEACDFEFHLPRPSYTVNTLRELSRAYPEHEFTLIIGEDNLQILDRWRDWEYLITHYDILVYPRHSGESKPYPVMSPRIHLLTDAPYFDISSTQLRQQITDNS